MCGVCPYANAIASSYAQEKANRASAIFGGKFPHATAIFPGGCTLTPNVDHISTYRSLILEVRDFIHKKYLADLLAVAESFPDYWHIGQSKGGFLSYGLLPLGPKPDSRRLFASGVIMQNSVQPVDFEAISEDVKYSRYSSPSGLKIREGALEPAPHKESAYTWIKAPRYKGQMMEVGAAARVTIDYLQGNNPTIKQLVDKFAAEAGIGIKNLNSVLGRHLSRAISGVVIADFLLAETEKIDPGAPAIADFHVPESGEGFGATEASRGALLHYIKIKNYPGHDSHPGLFTRPGLHRLLYLPITGAITKCGHHGDGILKTGFSYRPVISLRKASP